LTTDQPLVSMRDYRVTEHAQGFSFEPVSQDRTNNVKFGC
jgi:hypothetical protein